MNNPEMMEMPFPTVNMTRGELACVADTARDLDLDVKFRGSDVSVWINGALLTDLLSVET